MYGRLKFLEKTPRRVASLVTLANKAAYHSEPPDAFDRAQAVSHWIVIRRHLTILVARHWLSNILPKIKGEKEKEPVSAQIG